MLRTERRGLIQFNSLFSNRDSKVAKRILSSSSSSSVTSPSSSTRLDSADLIELLVFT